MTQVVEVRTVMLVGEDEVPAGSRLEVRQREWDEETSTFGDWGPWEDSMSTVVVETTET